MVDYKRILKLKAEDTSQRGIAAALRCSRNTVAAVLAAAANEGLGYREVAALDNGEIRHLLFPELEEKVSGYTQPDFEWVHKELGRTGVTLLLLWNEYAIKTRQRGGVPYQYSFFCEKYRAWAQVTKATLHIPRKPGEIIEVDWAGDTMEFADPLTGEIKVAYLFVAALVYSAYAYVEAFADMKLSSWIDAHIHAFSFFGGAARLLVPDNLKTGVKKPDRYEPALNSAYAALAEHYSTTIIPARIKAPRDKSTAEGSVRHIAYQIMANLRNRRFVGIYELNDAISEELERLNVKPFTAKADNRAVVFTRDELPLLFPLPAMPFEMSESKTAKVGPNYHVQVDGCFYSVPHYLIAKTLDIRLTARAVEIFDGTARVATHPRIHGRKGAYSTVEEHMPEKHRQYLRDWTPERFINWAKQVGARTEETVRAILASKKIVEQGYRSCMGVLSLAKKEGGKKRLEAACAGALAITASPSYTLVKRLWSEWTPDDRARREAPSLGSKGFVRGSGYFARKEGKGDDR
jgi:transposase